MNSRHFELIKILILLFLIAGLLDARAISLPDGPEVGQPAPILKLSTWLQSPSEAAEGWPTGKVVVLEFWSTGCGPCVAYIPELNALAEKFKGKPVQFIAVTDDSETVVERFLKKTPINAWLGLGVEAGFGEGNPYKVAAIPHTVIIDARGRIAAIIDPFVLTSEMIQSCLDGTLGMPAGEQSVATNLVITREGRWTSDGNQMPGIIPGQYKMGIKPLFQIMILPVPTNSTNSSSEKIYQRPIEIWSLGRALTLQNDTLNRAIEVVFNVKPTLIVANAPLPKDKYNFFITLPTPNRHPQIPIFESLFSQAVEATFGLTVKREMKDIDVLIIKTNSTSLDTLSKSINSEGKYSAFADEAAATNQPLSMLAQELEISSAMPVLDESGLTNLYDFDIKWQQTDYAHPNVSSMIEAVQKLGLNLVPVKKSTEVVVVSKMP
jgi:uncharacterized protein (TIGR03435 family)